MQPILKMLLSISLSFAFISSAYANGGIEPVIQGKVYPQWYMDAKKLGKPKKIVKGGRDECNDTYFPDQWEFGSYTVLASGQIKEAYFSDNNTVIFHRVKIPYALDQAAFKKKFKDQVYEGSQKNILSSEVEGSNDSIDFIFRNGKLFKYRLNIDDC